ncbi:MAG: hypothetical protein H6Q14_386 [Bacteroidetes bacterium]|nr:hypothetical protein [Bacteroidota bacterium]
MNCKKRQNTLLSIKEVEIGEFFNKEILRYLLLVIFSFSCLITIYIQSVKAKQRRKLIIIELF